MRACGLISATALPESGGTAAVLPLGWTAREQVFSKNGLSLFVDGFIDVDEGTVTSGHSDEKDLAGHLANLYKQEGVGLLRRLRGSFALALWDAPTRRLILAVDPFATRSLLTLMPFTFT